MLFFARFEFDSVIYCNFYSFWVWIIYRCWFVGVSRLVDYMILFLLIFCLIEFFTFLWKLILWKKFFKLIWKKKDIPRSRKTQKTSNKRRRKRKKKESSKVANKTIDEDRLEIYLINTKIVRFLRANIHRPPPPHYFMTWPYCSD